MAWNGLDGQFLPKGGIPHQEEECT